MSTHQDQRTAPVWGTLPDACYQAGCSYNVGLRRIMIGEWIGKKEGGRWWVEIASLDQARRIDDRATRPVRSGVRG